MTDEKPVVGISSCLLGAKVRWDSNDKTSQPCRSMLSNYVDYLPYCPEVAAGFGVPRAPINLYINAKNEGMLTEQQYSVKRTDLNRTSLVFNAHSTALVIPKTKY